MAGEVRELRRYFLSLGSNIRPEENLRAAARLLSDQGRVLACAPVYRSPAYGDETQPDYLNSAVLVESNLTPREFQDQVIGGIERDLGRVRTDNPYDARTIDIDIIFVDQEIFRLDHRTIPSPEVLERAFVAVPLARIAPGFVHPTQGNTLAEITARFPPEAVREIAGPLCAPDESINDPRD